MIYVKSFFLLINYTDKSVRCIICKKSPNRSGMSFHSGIRCFYRLLPTAALPLELEVNEWAAICTHELVNYEDDERRYCNHRRNRERCKRDAVAGLELLRNPVDEHACDKHEDDVDVFHRDGVNCVPAPCGTHLVHHVLCRVPCDFVCFCRVEVRACAEEETCERDEHERKRNVPCCTEPWQSLVAEQVINDGRVNTYKEYAKPYGGNCAYRNRVVLVEDGAQCKEPECNRGAYRCAALDPELVEHLAKAVQTAPDDEVPTGAMPPTANNLRCHGVHVRGNCLAGFWLEVGENANVNEEYAERNADPHASRKKDGHKAQESHPEECAYGCVSVTAKRNVQVVAPPARKRNMPTAPEFGRALCLVRAVEVLRQAEAHEECNTNRNVRVTREVRINLERISEKCNEVFEAGEQEWSVENAVHKVRGEVVAQDNLLGKAVQNPEHSHAESAAGEEVRLVELRNELVGTNNRACHELREE